MSTNAHTTRRSVLTGTTAVMFGGQALAETPPRGPFTIEGWKTVWNSPSPQRVMARIPLITTPDVTGYWPRATRPVRGPKESQDGRGAQPFRSRSLFCCGPTK